MSTLVAWSAFARRGARRTQALRFLVYSGLAVSLVLLLSAWIVEQVRAAALHLEMQNLPEVSQLPASWNVLALADVFCVFLLMIALFLVVPAQVVATVASERRSGTLDQLRTTPLRPLALLVGLVGGVPARIYTLCAAPLALHLACGLFGIISLEAALTSTIVLAVGGLASALLGAAAALAPRQEAGGALLALGLTALLGLSGFVAMILATDHGAAPWAFVHPAGALNAIMLSHDGLWRQLFANECSMSKYDEAAFQSVLALAPVASSLFMLVMGGLFARGACRKLESPEAPLFSKPLALLTFSAIACALWLPPRTLPLSRGEAWAMPFVTAIFLVPAMVAIGAFATPSAEAWAARIRSGTRVRPWDDRAAPHGVVWAMLAVFIALTIGRSWTRHGMIDIRDREALALAWLLFAVAALPSYIFFATTRYQTAGGRWAFGCAIFVHAIFQLIGITIVLASRHSFSTPAETVCKLSIAAALIVPALVVWRQRALATRTRLRVAI